MNEDEQSLRHAIPLPEPPPTEAHPHDVTQAMAPINEVTGVAGSITPEQIRLSAERDLNGYTTTAVAPEWGQTASFIESPDEETSSTEAFVEESQELDDDTHSQARIKNTAEDTRDFNPRVEPMNSPGAAYQEPVLEEELATGRLPVTSWKTPTGEPYTRPATDTQPTQPLDENLPTYLEENDGDEVHEESLGEQSIDSALLNLSGIRDVFLGDTPFEMPQTIEDTPVPSLEFPPADSPPTSHDPGPRPPEPPPW